MPKFSVNKYRFPNVEIKSQLFRQYPFGTLGSHFIGYIGRMNDSDIARLKAENLYINYKGSQYVGKEGIEKYYEKVLHGFTGFQQVETDANGRAVRVLADSPAIAGASLTLSIDAKLQQVAEKAFGNYRGALVAINPQTGEVLSYVSMPTFDPNLFVDGIDEDSWNDLNQSEDRPLINRPIRGFYPPGSTFKPFVALAGLHFEKRRPPFSISDRGYFTLAGNSHHYRDWKPEGHGVVDMKKALTVSCDTFFYGLAQEIGIDRLNQFIASFRFG